MNSNELRINKKMEWSKALNREIETTSYNKEFWNDLTNYNNLAKSVNKDLEEKKHYVFFKRKYARDWLKKVRENISKINSLYINLLNEVKEAKIDDENLISKKRIKKLDEVRYYEDAKNGNFTGYREIKEPTHL